MESNVIGRPPQVRLKHTKPYSWLASARDERSRRLVGHEPIAVLRVVAGEDFHPMEGLYRAPLDELAGAGRPDWWMREDQYEWRAALGPGRAVAVRRHEEDGTPTGRAGPWIAVYRIREVDLGSDGLEVRMEPRRIAEVGS